MTILVNMARLLFLLARLPGRAVSTWFDGVRHVGSQPLNWFMRGTISTLTWLFVFVLVAQAFLPDVSGPVSSTGVEASSSNSAEAERDQVRASVIEQDPTGPMSDKLAGAGVMAVTDGDTFVVAINGEPQSVRVLGIDSCESGTPGGALATAKARELLVGSVGLRAESGVDKDRYGRLLRYVQTSSGDFGQAMVGYDHTGVYQGHNDASPEYVRRLYAHDRDHTALPPPAGRDCGESPPVVDGPDDHYVPVPDGDDDDDDHKSRFCRKHWFC